MQYYPNNWYDHEITFYFLFQFTCLLHKSKFDYKGVEKRVFIIFKYNHYKCLFSHTRFTDLQIFLKTALKWLLYISHYHKCKIMKNTFYIDVLFVNFVGSISEPRITWLVFVKFLWEMLQRKTIKGHKK